MSEQDKRLPLTGFGAFMAAPIDGLVHTGTFDEVTVAAVARLDALQRAFDETAFANRTPEQAQAEIDFIYASNSPETIALLQKHYWLPPPRLDSADSTD